MAASLARAETLESIETLPFRRDGEQFGPYAIYEQLGEGGMASVHRAEMIGRDGFRKTVALKRMRTEWTSDPDFIEAFVHEAQLASRLSHPNIAQAYDLGKIEGTYYIAMELVQGPTLAQIMKQSRLATGNVPLGIALEILIQLCDALDHAHELRDPSGTPLELIHRDVSPSNVIVSKEGIVKLIDFGIAKARSARRSTQVGIIKGKHGYIAPEYTYGQLDRRVDLWGLGVIAHELLTGRRLFVGENEGATIRNVRHQEIKPPSHYVSGISQDLDDIVMTALQREPDERWQNAGAMRVALTTEARRLRYAVSCAQIRDWVEWAFQQQPRCESTMAKMLDTMDPSISIRTCDLEAVTPTPTTDAPTPVRPLSIAPIGSLAQVSPRAVFAAAVAVTTPGKKPPAPARVPRGTPAGGAPANDERAAGHRAATVDAWAWVGKQTVPSAPARARTATQSIVMPGPSRASLSAPRAPRWNPPTRWTRDADVTSSAVPLVVLLALIAFAVLAVANGWIDLERWRQLLS